MANLPIIKPKKTKTRGYGSRIRIKSSRRRNTGANGFVRGSLAL